MSAKYYIGLMSGTSMDGIDGVLVSIQDAGAVDCHLVASACQPFDSEFKREAMLLQSPGDNEIHREALLGNQLAHYYAQCVMQLLESASIGPQAVTAIGAHGQTIRHCPHQGYSKQTINSALLAELTGIDVIADFRSRDIAAGGQGAPLVPGFHHAIFANANEHRVIANIGGISNITLLQGDLLSSVTGFDTGPGNMLMDAWTMHHLGMPFDKAGAWAATGTVNELLLQHLKDDGFFRKAPPKSTGRDLFDMAWLECKLVNFRDTLPEDIQATLLALTATTLADAIVAYAPEALAVYVCGGGAYNDQLLLKIEQAMRTFSHHALVTSTVALGVSPIHVEAMAFAWLAARYMEKKPSNLANVTGAQGARILGACYPG